METAIFRSKNSVALALVLAVLAIVGTLWASADDPPRYTTDYGSEPDKWASAWLIRHHIAPRALVVVHHDRATTTTTGDTAPLDTKNTTWFDVPGAKWARTGSHLTYQQLLESHGRKDPALVKLGEILSAIERVSWTTPFSADTEAVESTYRGLQAFFYPNPVPLTCYYDYFDAVTEAIEKDALAELSQWLADLIRGINLCAQGDRTEDGAATVPMVAIADIVRWQQDGDEIVFIDTRERAEYEARHIAGAINIPLRKLKQTDVSAWSNAKLIVPYCVKDFRGYEVARKLTAMGLSNVAMMKPHGLNGWLAHGLPVRGSRVASGANGSREPKTDRANTGDCGAAVDCRG